MDCNVIMDLLPLYIDDCCSEESKALVETHLGSCRKCKQIYMDMRAADSDDMIKVSPPTNIGRINQFKASLLQSVILFLSFLAIVIGVTLEARTPVGTGNGNWAYMLIVPATAFMLSLANWYFVRVYKNRAVFSNCSLLVTAGFSICGFVWAVFHYGSLASCYQYLGVGIVVSVVLCVASKLLSSAYAKIIGKE